MARIKSLMAIDILLRIDNTSIFKSISEFKYQQRHHKL